MVVILQTIEGIWIDSLTYRKLCLHRQRHTREAWNRWQRV